MRKPTPTFSRDQKGWHSFTSQRGEISPSLESEEEATDWTGSTNPRGELLAAMRKGKVDDPTIMGEMIEMQKYRDLHEYT